MNVSFGKYDHIIRARVMFYRARFNAYITATGMTHHEGLEHITRLSREAGGDAAAAEVDKHVPEDLHSSRRPELGEEVEHA